jgi:hypothetical protein
VGSKGTGNFGDFSPAIPSADRCAEPIEDGLEEVARSEELLGGGTVPAPGTALRLRSELVDGRLAIEVTGGRVVGLLPTKYSYLALCMARGIRYDGGVVSSSSGPIPRIRVSLVQSA